MRLEILSEKRYLKKFSEEQTTLILKNSPYFNQIKKTHKMWALDKKLIKMPTTGFKIIIMLISVKFLPKKQPLESPLWPRKIAFINQEEAL